MSGKKRKPEKRTIFSAGINAFVINEFTPRAFIRRTVNMLDLKRVAIEEIIDREKEKQKLMQMGLKTHAESVGDLINWIKTFFCVYESEIDSIKIEKQIE